MMLSLDQFVFDMDTLPFQELQRQTNWKHRGNSRVGARDGVQFLGPGDDLVTINGVLVPELAGSAASLDDLRAMADVGSAYVLVDAGGNVYGAYVIEAVNETQTNHGIDAARRVDFTVGLRRVDDHLVGDDSDEAAEA